MDADRMELNAILMSLYLMIENKERIIYFPLWNNKVADKNMYRKPLTENRYQNFDVMMLSHTLQFPIHDWKELRAKLRKARGQPHSKEIVLSQAKEKMNRIYQKHKKTDAYFKRFDEIGRYFRFDTHFLVGGPYFFATFFWRLHEVLAELLEHRLSTWHWLTWVAIPQRRSDKNDWLELGSMTELIEKITIKHHGNSKIKGALK